MAGATRGGVVLGLWHGLPRPPNGPVLGALWSLFDRIWGVLKCGFGALRLGFRVEGLGFKVCKMWNAWFWGALGWRVCL